MKKLYQLLDGRSKSARILNGSFAILILLNIVAVILDSYQKINIRFSHEFYIFEVFSIVVFSIEYVFRVITAPYKYDGKYSIKNFVRYIISPLAIIDLMSILPFYLPLLLKMDLRFIRIVRVFRLVRIMKIKRYSKSLDIIIRILKKKRTDLAMTVIIIGILLLLSGSVMYYVENDLQPDLFPNILQSSIWALKTMVFLGYENPPLSIIGKILGLIITLLGLGWIAMPISIISSGFVEEIDRQKECEPIKCPHCGKEID
jgi:voltage-gated potassium channel